MREGFIPGAMEDTKMYPKTDVHGLSFGDVPSLLGSLNSDIKIEQFRCLVGGSADENHGYLEQGGHLVGSGSAQVRGGETEAKFLLVVL